MPINTNPWMNTQYGAPPPQVQTQETADWRTFPFRQNLALSDQVVNQPRNLVLKQTNTQGVQQVLGAAAFGAIPVANLVVPIPAQIRGSTVQGWLVQQLLASQNSLPGRP